MYEGIVRALTIAAVCATTSFVIMRIVLAIRRDDEVEWEFDLEGTLEELGNPEAASNKVWQFKTPGLSTEPARFWKETQAQDLIEYALMAGFVAVAAGAIMPGVADQISVIFSKVSSALASAGS